MHPIEFAVSLLAPHQCAVCHKEGYLLCFICRKQAFISLPEVCYHCRAPSLDARTCANCQPKTSIRTLWAATPYHHQAKELISLLKFQRAKAAAYTIAQHVSDVLPRLPASVIVCPVPTANSRVRTRGYDQSCLIAAHFARLRGLKRQNALRRLSTTRQVGASRQARFTQLTGAFGVVRPSRIAGQHILLIDDVLTTGATLEEAAKTLKNYGAKHVDAAVFARA